MKEIDRLKAIHADDPDPYRVGVCPLCGAQRRLARGRIPAHPHRDTGAPCSGGPPVPDTIDDYPEGFDSDPWVMNGGLPTLGKGHK